MNKLNEDVFVATICDHLDRSIVQLDSSIVERLDSARSQAFSATSDIVNRQASDDELLVDSVLTTLEEQADLPAGVEQRLNRIRGEALSRMRENAASPSPFAVFSNWLQDVFGDNLSLSASMIGTACLVVTVATLFNSPSDQLDDFGLDDELALVASADDLELYENLDFYLWLEENGFPTN